MTQEPYYVSILIPVHQAEKYIEQCVRSVFDQTYRQLEIIVVDDGSTDKSLDIIKQLVNEYPQRQSQTRIIHNAQNKGIATVRNMLLDAVTAPYFFFVDADDWLEKDAVEILVGKQIASGADIVTGQAYVNESVEDPSYLRPEYKDKNDMIVDMLAQVWNHELWARLIRTSMCREHSLRFLDEINQAEDWRFMPMLVWYAKVVANVDDKIYHYRLSDDSLCRKERGGHELLEFFSQEYQNYSALVAFFKDKKKEYYDIVRENSSVKCVHLLLVSCDISYRKAFYKYRQELLAHYKEFIRQRLGSKIALLLRFPRSYRLVKYYIWICNRW